MKFYSRLRVWLLSVLAVRVLQLLNLSIRWQSFLSVEPLSDGWLEESPKIFLFWHSRQLMLPFFFLAHRASPTTRISVLISQHSDGRIIAEAIRRLDLDSVAGSSSKGALEASKKLLRIMSQGNHIGVTPDGPRGPAEIAKLGIIKLAQLASVPIYPITYSCSSYWRVRSWDRMIIPRPFSRGVYVVGKPVLIPREARSGAELESYRITVEEGIREVDRIADGFFLRQ